MTRSHTVICVTQVLLDQRGINKGRSKGNQGEFGRRSTSKMLPLAAPHDESEQSDTELGEPPSPP